MKLKKRILLLALCACIIIPQTGCGNEQPVSESQFCLDTICTLTVYDMKKSQAEDAVKEAFSSIQQYENMLSKTVKESDVYKLNSAGGKAVQVRPETLQVIKKGIEYGRLSGGMFDITVGAVTELWDFTGDNPKVPAKKDLEKAVKTVDYRQIRIKGDSVSLKKKGAQLDLGGIAKGYIADRVTEVMEKAGVKRAIINLGGNIVTIGEKDEQTPWKIGIERPYSDRTEILGSVELIDETIVTSGIYERYFKEGGKLYHHVLNPKTGYPVENTPEAVTVKWDKGHSMDCDALGTICLMLGPEKSMKILNDLEGVQAAFVDQEDHVKAVKGMKILPAK